MKKSRIKLNNYVDVIGWAGVIAILTAYILLNFNFLTTKNLVYQILNLTGSCAILFESYKKKDYEPVILHLVWAIIAIIIMIRILI